MQLNIFQNKQSFPQQAMRKSLCKEILKNLGGVSVAP